eukprot:252727_1
MASFVLYIAWMTSSLAIASNTETNSLSCYAPRVPTELSHIEGRLGLIGSPIAQFDASSFMITQITQNSNYNPHYLFTQTPQFLKPVENEVHVDTLLNSSAPLWKGNPSIAQSASVSQLISTTVLFAHEHNNEGRDTFKWVPHCDGLDHTMQATNHATEQNHAFTTTTLPTLDYTTNNEHEHALIYVPNHATIAFPHNPVRSRFFEMNALCDDLSNDNMQATTYTPQQKHAFESTAFTLSTTDNMICPSRTKTMIDCSPTDVDPHPTERSICASTVPFSSLFFEDILRIRTCTRPTNNCLNTYFSPPSAIHSTAFNEATNAFNTTSSSPHALNLPIVQSSSVSQLISPSVLVTHGHNEGRHTFANNNIPGQQTEARMTGIQSIDEELTHTSTARIFTHPIMWIFAGYFIFISWNSSDKRIQKYLIIFILLSFTCCFALDVSAGWYHTCALSSQFHTVKCFGGNVAGSLGLGDTRPRGDEAGEMGDNLSTIDLGSNFDVVQIAVGAYHSCGLSQTGKVKCFGRNSYGQLGLGDMDHRGDQANE